MRVLYFSPRYCWPVTSGARLRDFHQARQLALNATLTYLGFVDGESRRERMEALNHSELILVGRSGAYAPLRLVRAFIGPNPITVLNYTSPRMMTALEELLHREPFDVIQVEGVHLFAYFRRIRELAPRSVLISDWHNIESEILARYAETDSNPARRVYARHSANLLRRCERRLVPICDAHTVCSERERGLLLQYQPSARIEVIENGVDAGYYSETAGARPRRAVLFVGSMDYHANIDAALYFANEIWPIVRGRRPELEFIVVGSRPAPAIVALRDRPGITVTGTVDDIRPFYGGALTVVVPLRVGSGTRLKVLEAMAAGVPVIATTVGAEGLTVTSGENILIADSATNIANTVNSLEADSPEWRNLAQNGRELVASRYDWSIIGEKLRRFHAALLGAVTPQTGPPSKPESAHLVSQAAHRTRHS